MLDFFNKNADSIHEGLSECKSIDQGIDYLRRNLRHFLDSSDELDDYDRYTEKRWLEVRSDLGFQEAILHIFEKDGTYLRILDGDIFTGSWQHLHDGIAIKHAGQHQLYELVFLDADFFILTKHGDHIAKGNSPKYFFIITESLSNRLERILKRKPEWLDVLVYLYSIYKNDKSYTLLIMLLVGLFLYIIFSSF
jgi:hypothetical protein